MGGGGWRRGPGGGGVLLPQFHAAPTGNILSAVDVDPN